MSWGSCELPVFKNVRTFPTCGFLAFLLPCQNAKIDGQESCDSLSEHFWSSCITYPEMASELDMTFEFANPSMEVLSLRTIDSMSSPNPFCKFNNVVLKNRSL
jgi:hypothetical protein